MSPRSFPRPLIRPRPRWWLEALESRLAPSTAHVAVIGDYGSGGSNEASVATLVQGWNPDVVITVGDNNYPDGSAATIDANIGQYYHSYIGDYTGSYGAGSATNRFFPALGNHDWITRSGSPPLPTTYLNYFTLPGNERYYTFTQGPIQFFVVDSGDGTGTITDGFDPDGYTSTSVQGRWLQSQLAASTATWKLVYFHHPPYGSGQDGSDTLMQWPFQAWGATAVLTGHSHDYERLNVGGFPYFIDGLGGESIDPFGSNIAPGSQVRYNGNYGAMRVDAGDTQIQFQFVSVAGTIIDSYTIQAPPAVTAQPSPQKLTVGQTATFTAAATGAATVNWQVSTDGSAFTDIAGATSTTYAFNPVLADTGKQFRAAFTNAVGSTNSNAALLTVQAPVMVANIQVNDGSVQRSEVRSLTINFSGAVNFAGGNGNAAAAFQLLHVQDATNIANLAAAVSTNGAGQTVVKLSFTTAGNAAAEIDPVSALNGGAASLADGRYQLTVLSAAVIDANGATLDGARTGTAGSNYVSPADTFGGAGLHLYRLFGDVNGDGVIDALDLGLFRSTYNANSAQANYLAFLDADNSGAVDASDLGQFRSRYNVNVF
jgi:tartrate-resistant acid phosphatase type 5